jgi:hypothetical protein
LAGGWGAVVVVQVGCVRERVCVSVNESECVDRGLGIHPPPFGPPKAARGMAMPGSLPLAYMYT